MFLSQKIRSSFLSASALGAVLSFCSTAFGHAFLQPKQVPEGAYEILKMSIPDGCGASPTIQVTIQIPASIEIAVPRPLHGWKLSTQKAPKSVSAPIQKSGSEGTVVREKVTSITWTGGEIPTDQLESFEFLVRTPLLQDVGTGGLFLPVIQKCKDGEKQWTDTSGNKGEKVNTAPKLTLIKAIQAPH